MLEWPRKRAVKSKGTKNIGLVASSNSAGYQVAMTQFNSKHTPKLVSKKSTGVSHFSLVIFFSLQVPESVCNPL